MPSHSLIEESSLFNHQPRWTQFLRSATSTNLNHFQQDDHHLSLNEHRKARVGRSLRKRPWNDIVDFATDLNDPSIQSYVKEDFDRFHLLMREIPSEKPNMVDEIALQFLYLLLKDPITGNNNNSSFISKNQHSEIIEYFGRLEPNLLKRIEAILKSLFSKMEPESRDQFSKKMIDWKSGEVNQNPEKSMFPFGKINIPQFGPSIEPTDEERSIFKLLEVNYQQNEVSEEDRVLALFMNCEKEQANAKNGPPQSAPVKPSSSAQDNEYLIVWDKNYLLNLIGNEDLLQPAINLIISERTNDAIQEQLFDLFGFEKLDLISKLLEKRGSIISDLNKEETLAKAVRNKMQSSHQSQSHPVIGVSVQSAEEKYLEKVYRKEEKKAQRAGNSLLNNSSYSGAVQQAEASVGNAMLDRVSKAQYSSDRGFGGELSIGDLPNVYDIHAEAKQKAGFISGLKIVLPENLKRKNEKDFEEVYLPPTKGNLPSHIASKELIKVSSLNPMAQSVFHGMKTLNRIQSLVFETAFKTNENLLICAPTGAGKTNIALLTVLHCIMQNTQDGEILKNQFKIIYVAPMKALAGEMTANFSKRLAPLGITVKELTGDIQLTKSEITNTQMIITTPEKWDVVTRKSTGDVALSQIVKLLIIDEIHLLHGDRGPVVETLVARTLRLVETSQRMIRLVGLSATLPNYKDIALFLRVNLNVGLFYFDSRFRPVPLGQTFIGVKGLSILDQQRQMDACCYDKVYEMVSKGHQVMVFVHARNATVKTAEVLIELAGKKGHLDYYGTKSAGTNSEFGKAVKYFEKSRNKKLPDLFQYGFSFHHAGMLRSDRNMVEKLFSDGLIKVLCCTSTLAWGVNLPAHAVVIKGTEIYDTKQGSFVDLGILDVLQIFGRAGRPQFDTEGQGTIITTHDKLPHYLSLLTNQFPIESNFIKFLADNLNAEIGLGTVTNIDEAIEWLTYTYLFIRMRRNPQHYGMQYGEAQDDPLLMIRRRELIIQAAKKLDKAEMIRFDERTEYFHSTDLGRTASYFYIKYDTIETFNEDLAPLMNYDMIIKLITFASEFEQIKVRDDEMEELDMLTKEYCYYKVWGGSENVHGKVNILIQTYISRGFIKSFSLISDQQYVIQNAIRICRGFFEIVLGKNNPILASRFLEISKMLDQQLWEDAHPLRQIKTLSVEIMDKLERKRITIDKLKDLSGDEVGALISHMRMGPIVKRHAEEIPLLEISPEIQPITRHVLRVKINIEAAFHWNDRLHGNVSESFWIWVEDPDNNYIYHQEYFIITKRQVIKREKQELVFTIPVQEPLPTQYLIRVISDRYLGSNQSTPVSFRHLILPEQHPPHTDLLDLTPLTIKAFKNPLFESVYAERNMIYFNPIQTQVFHCLYHTDSNVLIGAPTGSGKTICAEIAMFRVFSLYPKLKVVYIAPMKALVRERMTDWRDKLGREMGKRVVELTGDVTPDMRAIMESDVIVTTPEKWDGISRSWQTRSYVQDVSLIIIDEIHLLGEDRGPVLEVIVSRTNYISQHTRRNLRVIGLSTALANSKDLADWLGIKGTMGLYNFRPSVRPVPIQVHMQGFHGKHYCPRMATMNKPTFQAIREHSPSKPSLIFVSSRRQTRLTALDLIAFLAGEGNPKQWLHVDDYEMEHIISNVKEPNLKLTLAFGIGIHHAGLQENDRKTVEELFVNQKIQVLVATATLAWGVNFPAHLVVIKGTEYYDGKTHRYVDMPITDVLQMMGRAGRPQYDDFGVAVVLVQDVKKNFYRKFLYEPFPVESSLLDVLPDHFNAEVVAGTITSTQDALNYLTCTYLFRRLLQNPSYYQLESSDPSIINSYLSQLVSKALQTLENASCLTIEEDLRSVEPTSFGRIAAYYYLSHQTMLIFRDRLLPNLSLKDLLTVLTDVYEYDQLPVRHNEDVLNEELAKSCPIEVTPGSYNSPHTKAHLLFQCHFSRLQLPSSDYYTDLKSVLDQALRILQAMIDTCAERGWLNATISCINIIQMTVQARWLEDDAFLSLPHMDEMTAGHLISKFKIETIPELQEKVRKSSAILEKELLHFMESNQIDTIYKILQEIPEVSLRIEAHFEGRVIPVHYSRGATKNWIDLPPGKDLTFVLYLTRENKFPRDMKVHAHRFPKPKDESWFLILGDIENRELVALKRAGGIKRKVQQSLGITTPDNCGRVIYNLYLLCDSYLGIDQQYEICLNITQTPQMPSISGPSKK